MKHKHKKSWIFIYEKYIGKENKEEDRLLTFEKLQIL